MATIIIPFLHKVDGVYTDVTSVVLEDPTSAYGVKRDDTDAVVVAAATALVKQDTGIYQYSFTAPADGLTYTYYLKWVYAGSTSQIEFSIVGVSESPNYSQLQNMRQNFRDFSGMSGTDEISNSKINVLLNDFYKTVFITEVYTTVFDSDYTQAVTATDDGVYSLATSVEEIKERVTFNNAELTQYKDKNLFFSDFPDQEDYITDPTLVIGTSSAAAVKNSSFDYQIAGWTYTGAAAETALSGDNIPQSTYGAWMLSIDADGDITITEADDNSTGYSTAAKAVNGIDPSTSDAVMGFVTAINTSGVFDPGTTELSAVGVTATYTDGNPGLRMIPDSFLVDGRKLYIRPKSDDKGLIKARLMMTRPDELSGDTSTVFDEKWGTAIAVGTAASYWATRGDTEKSSGLTGSTELPGSYRYLVSSINRDWYISKSNQYTSRSY